MSRETRQPVTMTKPMGVRLRQSRRPVSGPVWGNLDGTRIYPGRRSSLDQVMADVHTGMIEKFFILTPQAKNDTAAYPTTRS